MAPLKYIGAAFVFAISQVATAAEPVRGEQYDLAKYKQCREKDPRNSQCEIYRLVRPDNPETWPYHDKSPMRWPEPPKENVYKRGMNPEQYWKALCDAEAGEFIYKPIKNVRGFYLIRPRAKEMGPAAGDRYVMEDPYGYVQGELGTMTQVPWMWVGAKSTSDKSPDNYAYLETPTLPNDLHETRAKYYPSWMFTSPSAGMKYQHYSGYDGQNRQSMLMKYTNKVESRYGVTWRGIQRFRDRELGIAGGELAVVDLKSAEIVGIRRGFLLAPGAGTSQPGWAFGRACPDYLSMPGIGQVRKRNKDMDFSLWFISKVLLRDEK